MAHHDPEVINSKTRPEDGYEKRDFDYSLSWKGMNGTLIGTLVCIVISIPLYWITIHGFDTSKWFTSLRGTEASPRVPAPHPMVQTNTETKVDIHKLREDEAKKTATIDQTLNEMAASKSLEIGGGGH